MQLTLAWSDLTGHQAAVTDVAWISAEEVITVSEDHTVLCWNVVNQQSRQLCQLDASLFPICMRLTATDPSLPTHGHAAGGGTAAASGGVAFIVGSSDVWSPLSCDR